jgi:capsular polysaccharide biosynthesis protein
MTTPPASPLPTIGRALRLHHRLVWGCALVAAVVALAASLVRAPTYQATAMLNIDESQYTNQGFDLALQADQYLTQRYISMATSQAVLNKVCSQEGHGCTAPALARQISGGTTRATGQVTITASASSAQAAARLANEVARAIITQNRAYVTGTLNSQRQLLQQQLSQIGAQMAATERAIEANTAANRDAAGLVAQLTTQGNQYQTTYSHIQDLDLQQNQLISGLTLQQPATPPSRPTDPDPVRYVLVGVAAGLTVGFLAALLAERFRQRVMDGAELAEIADTDLVLTVDRQQAPIVMASYGLLSPGDAREEASGAQLLLVAASADVPVDDLAMDLASAVAAQRRRAAVDPAGPGRARQELGGRRVGWPLQPHGGTPEDGDADLTIRCASPLAYVALWLRPSVGPAVLVASRGKTRLSEVRRTAELLRHTGLNPVAVILLTDTRVSPRGARGLLESDAPALEPAPAKGSDSKSEASAS